MIGTIISGTHRPEDLIPALIDALSERLDQAAMRQDAPEFTRRYGQVQDRLGEIERRMASDAYFGSEDASWDLDWIFDTLDEFAPEGTRFGAHEGDGADFGFWPVEEAS